MTKYSTQRLFDGRPIEHHQMRLTGTFDLPEDDLDNVYYDALTVLVVAVRVNDVGIKMLGDSGESRLKYVGTAEYAVPLAGPLREQALTFLRDQHGVMDFPAGAGDEPADEPVGYAEPVIEAPTPPVPVDADGVIQPEVEVIVAPADVTMAEAPQPVDETDRESRVIERSGPIPDDSPPTPGAFKTARFDPSEAPDGTIGDPLPPEPAVPTAEVVGQVREGARADTDLERFLSEPV